MQGRRAQVEPLQIARSWFISYRSGGVRRFLRIMFWGHVVLPHGAMCVGLLIAYLVIACPF
jgi:hypothetical protein